MEEYREIKNFPNYQVSNLGNIKNLKGKLLSKYVSKKGYVVVCLYKNNKGTTKTVHRLIAQAFIPNPENKPYINHIDSNRANNDIKNLEWCTQSENLKHGYKYGKVRPPRNDRKIIMMDMNENYITTFDSIKKAANFIDGDPSHITKVLKEKLNHHKYKKFKYLIN